ncbi:hypothetical protein L107_12505 [Cyanobium sp. Copco_Reservoir_LC18]|nr:hypothetical protein L107_12505 [Cyanobium sp. Copco_Reservoir_LC18]
MGRVVIVDPAYASSVGHHADVNALLLKGLAQQGWAAECWADGAVAAEGCRGVFNGCGYLDPRHWADLGGTVHLARRVEQQLLAERDRQASESSQPPAAWVIHTALPFQLLGLARALRRIPAATVVVSLMFPPGETLGKDEPQGAATGNCRVALGALAQAVSQGGHRLRLELPSQQSLELHAPLLAAAGLACSGLHPAVVGAGLPVAPPAAGRPAAAPGRPRILLHWGDLKPGKGRREALEVVKQLLGGGPLPPSLEDAEWLFQLHSQNPLAGAELGSLERARELLPRFRWLNERVPMERMQDLLAGCDVALLAYDPVHYRHRSSGLLWCYGAARLMAGQSAAVVGRAGGWLEREASNLGMKWRSGSDGDWLEHLAAAAVAGAEADNGHFTTYGRWVLGESFAAYVAQLITHDEAK